MNHVHVIIPTLDRHQLLLETVASLFKCEHKDLSLTIVVDANRRMFEALRGQLNPQLPIAILLNEKRIGWGKTVNAVIRDTDYDFYFYASDDLKFHRYAIENAVRCMSKIFPDGDGVIGIRQNLPHYCPAAFGLVGRKWLRRFPNRALFNPAYQHFCVDSELWHYARQKNKFHFCEAALVKHERPNDGCHRLAQTTLSRDRAIWRPRKASGRFYPEFP